MELFRRFSIRIRLLFGYSLLVVVALLIGHAVVYLQVKGAVKESAEKELYNYSTSIVNMVKTAAALSVKNHLRGIAEKNHEIVTLFYEKFRRGEISEREAMERSREVLLSQKIGTTGYLYCMNSSGILTVHPEPELVNTDISQFDFAKDLIRLKTGYIEYGWKNPGDLQLRPKAVYITYFKPWDWVIAASSYRDEFASLVGVESLRESVLALRSGKSGYCYIVDGKGEIIIHPFYKGRVADVGDGRLVDIVRRMYEVKTGILHYRWQNPGESADREKMVVFRYLAEYDWIIAASGYEEEITTILGQIEKIILITVVIALMLIIPLTLSISSSITSPLLTLMKYFETGASGDFSVRVKDKSRDEVGLLADYFNNFMKRLETFKGDLECEIHRRGEIEAELIGVKNYLVNVMDSMPFMLLGLDSQGHVMQWNHEVEMVTGFTSERILEKPVWEVLTDPMVDMDTIHRVIRERLSHRIERVESVRDGAVRYLDIIVYPLVGDDTRGVVVRVEDVTEKIYMEEIMIQSEKMMTVGSLAAGMAHEINNPLAGILQNIQVIKNRTVAVLPANTRAAEKCGIEMERLIRYLEMRGVYAMMDDVSSSGQRAAKIVKNMLSFSRKSGASGKQPHQLCEILDRSVELAASDYDLKKRYDFRAIEIVREYEANMPDVICDEGKIQQVFLNLLKNGAQAMGKKEEPSGFILRIRRIARDAVVEIEDNGIGIPEHVKERIFDPFYTTKGKGVGTGLGLSVSRFIVAEDHGGRIYVKSQPGEGTTFTLTLPLGDRFESEPV